MLQAMARHEKLAYCSLCKLPGHRGWQCPYATAETKAFYKQQDDGLMVLIWKTQMRSCMISITNL